MEYFSKQYASPIGTLTVISNADGICGLFTETQNIPSYLKHTNADSEILFGACRWLDAYFAGEKPSIDSLSLAPKGTPFQTQVWQSLRSIPYGQTISYGQIAEMISDRTGKPMSAQAVGQAVGANPISIIVPCHRVIGSNGKLTGYAGGIETKIKLLAHEGVHI